MTEFHTRMVPSIHPDTTDVDMSPPGASAPLFAVLAGESICDMDAAENTPLSDASGFHTSRVTCARETTPLA